MKYFFLGHHKCGTTWVIKYLYQLCGRINLRHQHYHSAKDFGFDLNKSLDAIDFCSLTNAKYSYLEEIGDFKAFHVIRDPRDILVSAYFSHKNSHGTKYWPELIGHREKLQDMPLDEGLLYSFEFTEKLKIDGYNCELINSIQHWDYDDDRIMELKFEDFIRHPYEYWINIFKFLNLLHQGSDLSLKRSIQYLLSQRLPALFGTNFKPSISMLLNTQYDNSFKRLSGGRTRGDSDAKSHFRKGLAGDWKNYFKEMHKDYFKKKYPGILVKLGYEKDDNW